VHIVPTETGIQPWVLFLAAHQAEACRFGSSSGASAPVGRRLRNRGVIAIILKWDGSAALAAAGRTRAS